MSVHEDNTTPISNDSVARLQVRVLAGRTLGIYIYLVHWGRPGYEEVIKQA